MSSFAEWFDRKIRESKGETSQTDEAPQNFDSPEEDDRATKLLKLENPSPQPSPSSSSESALVPSKMSETLTLPPLPFDKNPSDNENPCFIHNGPPVTLVIEFFEPENLRTTLLRITKELPRFVLQFQQIATELQALSPSCNEAMQNIQPFVQQLLNSLTRILNELIELLANTPSENLFLIVHRLQLLSKELPNFNCLPLLQEMQRVLQKYSQNSSSELAALLTRYYHCIQQLSMSPQFIYAELDQIRRIVQREEIHIKITSKPPPVQDALELPMATKVAIPFQKSFTSSSILHTIYLARKGVRLECPKGHSVIQYFFENQIHKVERVCSFFAQSTACDHCHRMHKKCSLERPCQSCVERGLSCSDVLTPKANRSSPSQPFQIPIAMSNLQNFRSPIPNPPMRSAQEMANYEIDSSLKQKLRSRWTFPIDELDTGDVCLFMITHPGMTKSFIATALGCSITMVTQNGSRTRIELTKMIQSGKKISAFHYLFKNWINTLMERPENPSPVPQPRPFPLASTSPAPSLSSFSSRQSSSDVSFETIPVGNGLFFEEVKADHDEK